MKTKTKAADEISAIAPTIALADEITKLSDWIKSAEAELSEFKDNRGRWNNQFSFRVSGKRSGGFCFYIEPEDFPEDQTERLSKYYRKIVLEQIRKAKAKRSRLISKLKKAT